MKIAFACPNAPGHWNPSLALASELQSRGHEVCLAGFRDAKPKADAAGIRLCAVAEDEFPEGEVARSLEELGRLSGFAAVRFSCDYLQREHLAYIRDLPRVCNVERFDGMVIDQVSLGAATVAQAGKIPYTSIANALWISNDPSCPAFNSSLVPGRGLLYRLRNKLEHFPLRLLLNSCFKPINQERRTLGLYDNVSYNKWAESELAIVAQQPDGFAFPEEARPDHVHFTGPFFRYESREVDTFDWDRFDQKPIIYVSMGTVQNRLAYVYRTIAAACAGLGVQVLIALGDRNATIGDGWPGNTVVMPYAPQLEALKRAALVITHAGNNTVLESLAHGVPMVAIPITNDQPAVAARLVRIGAGAALPLKQVREDRLRELISKVLTDTSYRESARRMQRTIKESGGRQAAAAIIERALTERRTITRDCMTPTETHDRRHCHT